MSNPDAAALAALDAIAVPPLSSYSVGTNLFLGPPRPPSDHIPHAAIFVAWEREVSPLDTFDGSGGLRRHEVRIYVRGNVDAYAAAQAVAVAVRGAMHRADLSASGFNRCAVSDQAFLGRDDTEHPMFGVSLEVWEAT